MKNLIIQKKSSQTQQQAQAKPQKSPSLPKNHLVCSANPNMNNPNMINNNNMNSNNNNNIYPCSPVTQYQSLPSITDKDRDKQKDNILTFEETIEKQLEEDFKVYEYLNQYLNDSQCGNGTSGNQGYGNGYGGCNNSNGGNKNYMEVYVTLLNSLLVRKMEKKKKKEGLLCWRQRIGGGDASGCGGDRTRSVSRSKINNKSLEGIGILTHSPEHHQQSLDSYYTDSEYQKIKEQSLTQQHILEQKTEQQLQMHRILLQQITQKKKSIHLLKGDISHMIQRYESISVLESKVNKVNLVSGNQLKRISLALSKDKQQVQLRREMQKKFYNKLKHLQSFQSKNLKKIKQSYIQTIKRKKQIYQNLYLIEKQCQSIEQYSDKQKQYQEKNSRSLQLYRLICFVGGALEKAEGLVKEYQGGHQGKQIGEQKDQQRVEQRKQKKIGLGEFCKGIREIFLQGYKNISSMTRNNNGNNSSNRNRRNSTSTTKRKQQTQKSQKRSDQQIPFSNLQSSSFQIDQITQSTLQQLQKKLLTSYTYLTHKLQKYRTLYSNALNSIKQNWVKLSQVTEKLLLLYKENNIQCYNEIIQMEKESFNLEKYFDKVRLIQGNFEVLGRLMGFFGKFGGCVEGDAEGNGNEEGDSGENNEGLSEMGIVTQMYSNWRYHTNLRLQQQHQPNSPIINKNIFSQIQQKLLTSFTQIHKRIILYNTISAKIKQQIEKSVFITFVETMKNKEIQNNKEEENDYQYMRKQGKQNKQWRGYGYAEGEGPDGMNDEVDRDSLSGLEIRQHKEENQIENKEKFRQKDNNKMHHQQSQSKYTSIYARKLPSQQTSSLSSPSPFPQSSASYQQQTAKRVQILQKIDQSYYRMIKQTISMQKENTKKNYQFQKTFKRNKYSSQDELLQEKRFQATFSDLFKFGSKNDGDDGEGYGNGGTWSGLGVGVGLSAKANTKSKVMESGKLKKILKSGSSELQNNRSGFASLHLNNPSAVSHNLNSNTVHKPKKSKLSKILAQRQSQAKLLQQEQQNGNQKNSLMNNSGKNTFYASTKVSTNSTFWEKSKKAQLSSKLKHILSKV